MTDTAIKPYGPDLSSHNSYPSVAHDPDFNTIKASGASFVFIKKGQGTTYSFSKYARQVAQAKAAGLIVFDYHYLSYNALPADQVPAYLEGRQVDTKPCFDFENWSDSGEYPRRSHEYMQAWGHDFAIQLHAATGQWPTLYTYPSFWIETLGSPEDEVFAQCPLWIADYRQSAKDRGHPQVPSPWPFETFWQYTSLGQLPGVAGAVDMSRFNGPLENLKLLAGGT